MNTLPVSPPNQTADLRQLIAEFNAAGRLPENRKTLESVPHTSNDYPHA